MVDYKDKQKLEWKLKTTAIREERFEPPTWEEIQNKPEHYKEFMFHNKSKSFLLYLNDNNEIFLDSMEYGVEEELFFKPAIKENYIEAVNIARELFLGEEI